MRHAMSAAILGWSLVQSCGSAPAQPTELDAVERSIVRVVGDRGTGSGSVVAPGRVLTNWHVVEGERTLAVVSAHSGGEHRARLDWSSEQLDLAVLAVDTLTLPPAVLGAMAPRPRDRVWALGYPGAADRISVAHDVTWTEGVISRLHRARWEQRSGWPALEIIQHNADINPGNSGGPLVNDCGVVIGVNTAGVKAAQGTLVASRITEAVRELKQRGIEVKTTTAACEGVAARAAAEADTASDAAARAMAVAGGAATAVRTLADETDEATEAAKQARRLALAVGTLAVLALLLALRRPRREVARVVGQMSRRVRGRGAAGRRRERGAARVGAAGAPLLRLAAGAAGDILVWDTGIGRAAGGFVIGSYAPLVDGVATHPSVSRRHARVIRDGRRFYLEDLNSSNGTRLNGVSLDPFVPRAIAPGDEVRLGAMTVLSVQRARTGPDEPAGVRP